MSKKPNPYPKCRKCGVKLTNDNSFPSRFKHQNYICKPCAAILTMSWYQENPEKYKISYSNNNRKRRIRMINKVAKARGLSVIACENCGCDDVRMLVPNHLNGAPKDINRSGRNLWIQIIRMDDKTIRKEFDLRCAICNWLYYYEMKFGLKGRWKISWQKT